MYHVVIAMYHVVTVTWLMQSLSGVVIIPSTQNVHQGKTYMFDWYKPWMVVSLSWIHISSFVTRAVIRGSFCTGSCYLEQLQMCSPNSLDRFRQTFWGLSSQTSALFWWVLDLHSIVIVIFCVQCLGLSYVQRLIRISMKYVLVQCPVICSVVDKDDKYAVMQCPQPVGWLWPVVVTAGTVVWWEWAV